MRRVVGLTFALSLVSSLASAQSGQITQSPAGFTGGYGAYDVQTQSFDMWCQETQHYAPDRCDARQVADVEEYNAWRQTVERYQVPYLKRVEQERDENQRLHHDVQPRSPSQ